MKWEDLKDGHFYKNYRDKTIDKAGWWYWLLIGQTKAKFTVQFIMRDNPLMVRDDAHIPGSYFKKGSDFITGIEEWTIEEQTAARLRGEIPDEVARILGRQGVRD